MFDKLTPAAFMFMATVLTVLDLYVIIFPYISEQNASAVVVISTSRGGYEKNVL